MHLRITATPMLTLVLIPLLMRAPVLISRVNFCCLTVPGLAIDLLVTPCAHEQGGFADAAGTSHSPFFVHLPKCQSQCQCQYQSQCQCQCSCRVLTLLLSVAIFVFVVVFRFRFCFRSRLGDHCAHCHWLDPTSLRLGEGDHSHSPRR